MGVPRAVVLCCVGWAWSACVKEGAVLWYEVADASWDPLTTSSPVDPTSAATTGEPTTTTGEPMTTTGEPMTTTGEPTTTMGATGGTEETSPDDASVTSLDHGTTDEPSTDESSGSAIACIPMRGSNTEFLIDDLEDGDTVLPSQDGRRGWWWSQTDGTSGERIPEDPWAPTNEDAVSGEFAAHVSGEGFTGWGVQLGVTLNEECSYDASAYSGVEFWARGTGTVRMRFTTRSTVPVDYLPPGTCTGVCWDDFGTDVELTESWTRYTVVWGQLEQHGWGESADFDPIELIGFNWQGGSAMNTFDLWLDDIRFAPSDESSP